MTSPPVSSPVASLLTTSEVCDILSVSAPTLSRWRSQGIGPKWVDLGERMPRYRLEDVTAWVEGRVR